MHQISKSLLLAALTGLLLNVVQAAFAADDDVAQLFAKADSLLNHRKPKAAATILRELIRRNPDNAQAHMELGAAIAQQVEDDKYDDAIAEEKLALKLDPKSFGARKTLGHIYANQNKPKEAIAILKEAQELKPDSYVVHHDLAIAYVAAGEPDEAITALKKAIQLNPKKLEAYMRLSSLLSMKGNRTEAIAIAKQAVDVDSKKASPHLQLGNLLLSAKDYDGAIDSYKSAIAANGYDALGCLNPLTAATAFSGLGWAQASKDPTNFKVLEQAVGNERKAIKAYPSYAPSYLRIAKIFAMQDKPLKAETAFQMSLRASRGDVEVATDYAQFLIKQKRFEDARAILKKVLQKSPGYPAAVEEMTKLGDANSPVDSKNEPLSSKKDSSKDPPHRTKN